jgi:hypothetical protein
MVGDRDAELRALLPSKQNEYSFDSLSQAETDAFEKALAGC